VSDGGPLHGWVTDEQLDRRTGKQIDIVGLNNACTDSSTSKLNSGALAKEFMEPGAAVLLLSRFHPIPERYGQTDGRTDIDLTRCGQQCTCAADKAKSIELRTAPLLRGLSPVGSIK